MRERLGGAGRRRLTAVLWPRRDERMPSNPSRAGRNAHRRGLGRGSAGVSRVENAGATRERPPTGRRPVRPDSRGFGVRGSFWPSGVAWTFRWVENAGATRERPPTGRRPVRPDSRGFGVRGSFWPSGVEVLQRALNAAVASGWILRRHPHDERRDLLHEPGTPRPPILRCPLLGNQPPVPAQDRIRRHDGRHLPQNPATESLALRREAAALVVSQLNTAAPQLLPKGTVLFHQVVDHVLLVTIDPASQGREQKPQR